MDDRFPKYIRWLSRKMSFFAIPNLGKIVAGLAAMAIVAKTLWRTPLERFYFDPVAVLEGEWWRLFPFPLSAGLENPIWLFFFLLYVYFVLDALETAWGAASLTLFVLVGYLATIAGAFATLRSVPIWFYIMQNVSLAFGTVFPQVEFYLFFILPVKAKWLAIFAAVLLLLQFIVGSVSDKIFLAIVFLPYFVFFGPFLYSWVRDRGRPRRKPFDSDMWKR